MRWWVLLLLGACAEVPASVCFSDEACADGGVRTGGGGGSTGGGGAATGGGTGGGGVTGGGSATGGGFVTGGGSATGGGPQTGGGNWTSVTSASSSIGMPERARDLTPPGATPLAYDVLTLTAPTSLTTNCSDYFRGGVALPDGRVLAVPHCARDFVVVDPLSVTATAVFLAPLASLTGQGAWGGGVLGCDLRAYLLPTRANVPVMRVTPLEDAGLRFDQLPIVGDAPDLLTGGVVARPCEPDLLIIAAGRGGLFALEVFEEGVVSRALTPPEVAGVQFNGVARVGDSLVVSAPSVQGTASVMLWANTSSLSVLARSTPGGAASFGLTTASDGGLFLVSPTAEAWGVGASGPTPSRTVPGASRAGARWPATNLTGQVISAGASIIAWRDGIGADEVILADAGVGVTGGGVVLTPSGTIVVLPGAGSPELRLLVPQTPDAPGAQALSPWFNKL